MRVIDQYRPERDRIAVSRALNTEPRLAVEKRVDVDDKDGAAATESRRVRVVGRLEPERGRLPDDLLGEVRIGRQVSDGAFALVEARLQREQTDEGLAAARVHLDHEVP